jgi:hypothetical protein
MEPIPPRELSLTASPWAKTSTVKPSQRRSVQFVEIDTDSKCNLAEAAI